VVGIGLWIFVLASASLVSVLLVLKKESKIHPTGSRDLALFSLVTLWLGIFCYYFFLQLLHYPTQPWYYLILLVLVGVLCDGILVSATAFKNGLSVAVLLAVFFGVVLTFQPVNNTATIRLTNSDLVAAKLEKEAGEHDLVLMNPWYLGVSFNRYYHGKADWLTLPTLNYFRFHRYDQVKTQMMQPLQSEVVDPILQRMDATLKSGGKVFIVGGLRFLAENESPFYLPPAPNSPFKWQDGPYYISWSSQVASHLVAHITDASLLDVPSPQEVNPFENSPILVVSGWRP
jgi:hypothetical protein